MVINVFHTVCLLYSDAANIRNKIIQKYKYYIKNKDLYFCIPAMCKINSNFAAENDNNTFCRRN